ncbi:hypothetical protein FJTKL_11774 [Diaporthe vaccinii]|uniref:Uncharacterized protein n=1 Tax=Diaporthe vaccinii TaxID=105482 RepID=A0ABR4EFE1_9PEZI
MVGHLTLWRFRIRYQAVSAVFSHIDRDLTIRSKTGRHSCAVLGLREIDKERTGKGRSSVFCNVLDSSPHCRHSINDSDPLPLCGAQSSGSNNFGTPDRSLVHSLRRFYSSIAGTERKCGNAHVEKYWLVCFVFSSAFRVLPLAVSGPWQGCLVREPVQCSFFVLFPSLKRFRFGCIAVDMTFQTSHSSFLWRHSIRLGWKR